MRIQAAFKYMYRRDLTWMLKKEVGILLFKVYRNTLRAAERAVRRRAERKAAAANRKPRRKETSGGAAYTKEQFHAFFGDDGERRWLAAEPVAPEAEATAAEVAEGFDPLAIKNTVEALYKARRAAWGGGGGALGGREGATAVEGVGRGDGGVGAVGAPGVARWCHSAAL